MFTHLKSSTFLLLAGVWLLQACYPEGPSTDADSDIVITRNDPNYNFAAARTYALIDSVVLVRDSTHLDTSVHLSRAVNRFILNQVQAQLSARGYTRVAEGANATKPDLLVQVSAVATTNAIVFNDYYNNLWWNYWGWYPGWNYYYPYIGYGWYPYGPPAVYTYRTGTIAMEMYAPGQANAATKQLPRVWIGALQGVLVRNTAALENRIGAGITQAFQQSPYLKRAN